MVDTKGKNITPSRVNKSIKWSLAAGSIGMTWFILCTPQQILMVFMSNYLEASPLILGVLIGGINIAALFHLASIYFYSKYKTIKRFWIITAMFQRMLAFPIAAVAFYMAGGGNRFVGITVIIISSMTGAALGNMSASGWWSWMAALIPESKRATFFGKRSAVTQIVNVFFFFSATFVLDYFFKQAFIVFGILYLIAGVGGTLDILFHSFIPEPAPAESSRGISSKKFFEPVKDPVFLRFCILIGIYLMSINIAAPYLAPYTTNKDQIGAPNIWLGIMVVISQSIWVLVVPFWGMIMDKMGKKPVVIIGGLSSFAWIGYLFLTPENYSIVLPIIAVIAGILAPGFWEGISQMMLSLTKEENRTTYIAWFWTFFGTTAAIGSFLGGVLYNSLSKYPIRIGAINILPIHIIIILSLIMVIFSLSHLSRMKMANEKSISMVVSTIINPGIFRAFTGMGILSRPASSNKVTKVLKQMKGSSASLATSEVIMRLDDPDSTVRSEAAEALGRIGGADAEQALISHLNDQTSPVKVPAAKALGTMSSQRAVPFLIEALLAKSEDLQEAAVLSLGNIDSDDARNSLLKTIRSDAGEAIKASSAIAVSQQKVWDAAGDIFYLMHHASNWILKRQLSIAMANLLGNPGRFYQYVSGNHDNNSIKIQQLFSEVEKYIITLKKQSGQSKPQRQDFRNRLIEIKEFYESGDYITSARNLLSLSEEISNIFPDQNPFFDFGAWYLTKMQEALDEGIVADVDILLVLYFLKSGFSEMEKKKTTVK
ncbi:MAG: MFS transporter [Spirochaetaceae bacterium]